MKPTSDEKSETGAAADQGAAPETRTGTSSEGSNPPATFSPDLLADLVCDGNAAAPAQSSFRLEM